MMNVYPLVVTTKIDVIYVYFTCKLIENFFQKSRFRFMGGKRHIFKKSTLNKHDGRGNFPGHEDNKMPYLSIILPIVTLFRCELVSLHSTAPIHTYLHRFTRITYDN